eukprot:5785175-Pyramimonas_sp.AAC.1
MTSYLYAPQNVHQPLGRSPVMVKSASVTPSDLPYLDSTAQVHYVHESVAAPAPNASTCSSFCSEHLSQDPTTGPPPIG